MKTLLYILIALLAGTADIYADADTEYFHPAASLYIHGEAAASSNLVVQGLSAYPEDAKLMKLLELLQQDQQKQDQQKQDQQKQDQQKQDQQKQDQQKQDQQKQDQQKQDQQKQDQQQQQQDDQQESEQDQQPPPAEPQQAEQMSAEEAKQLMDAMKQEEENERLQLHPVMGRPVKVDKDW